LTVVCCLFYVLLRNIFFKGKEWDLFFLSGIFKKTRVIFFVRSNCINPVDSYGRFIDFLIQISKLSYFNVLDLADFMMHH